MGGGGGVLSCDPQNGVKIVETVTDTQSSMEAIMRQSSKDGAETASGTTPKHTGKLKQWSITDVPHQQILKITETHTSLASDVWSCFLQNQCTKSQPTQLSPEEPQFQTKRVQCFSCTDFRGGGGGGGGQQIHHFWKIISQPLQLLADPTSLTFKWERGARLFLLPHLFVIQSNPKARRI